ncbi:hypothetical protein HMI56_003394 [Coelomomyces lativittatus]|nr:hypothetical protein HMI56_003394 [Coelomomyces lativittatus]
MTSMLTFRRLSTKKMEMEDTDENGKGGKERHLTLSNEREEDQKEEEDGGGAGAGTAAGLSTSFSTTSTSLLTTTSHENSSSSSSSRLLRAHEDLEGTMKEKDVEEENLTLLERRKERTRMQGDLRDVLDPFSTSSTLLDARPRPFPPTFPFSRPPASSLMHPSSSSSSSSWTSKDQEGPAPAPPQEQGSSFVYPSSSSFMNKEGGVPPFLPPSPPYLLSTTTRVPKEGGGEEEEGGSHPSQGSEVQGSKKKMKKGTWTPPFKPLSQGGVGVGEGGGSRGSTSPHQGSRSRLDENENEKEKVDPSTRKHGDEKERLLSTTTPLPLSSRFSSSKMSTTSSMASRFSDATLNGWMVFSLSILAYVTRFLYIGWSNKVIWDEAHFGYV